MRREYQFLSTDKKNMIHAVEHKPEDGQIKAVLQLTHGMVEFIERYDHFAEYLSEHGFLVVGHDHLGHGQSVNTQNDWGYFPPEAPARALIEDMHRHRLMVQSQYPDTPYFILGHSMGSYLLRMYLADYGQGLAGAIIMGTGFVPASVSAFGIGLTRSMAKVKGWHHRSNMIQNLMFGKGYDDGGDLSNSWLSKDVEMLEKYRNSPACSFRFTLSGYLGLLQAVNFDCQQKNVDLISADLPILIVSGDQDPVGGNGEGVRKVHKMFQKAGIRDLTCKLYEGDRHEILNETDRAQVFEDLRGWMEARI